MREWDAVAEGKGLYILGVTALCGEGVLIAGNYVKYLVLFFFVFRTLEGPAQGLGEFSSGRSLGSTWSGICWQGSRLGVYLLRGVEEQVIWLGLDRT